jgi:hypothetical protein
MTRGRGPASSQRARDPIIFVVMSTGSRAWGFYKILVRGESPDGPPGSDDAQPPDPHPPADTEVRPDQDVTGSESRTYETVQALEADELASVQ